MIKNSTHRPKELKELNFGGFYEYEGKLLHATKDFMGYDPLISIPLDMPPFSHSEEQKMEYTFVVKNEIFRAVLTSAIFSGPLRGYKQIEIFYRENQIIFYKVGSQGFGSNYFQGEKFFFEGTKACLVVTGHKLKYDKSKNYYLDLDPDKYYLLIFSNVSFPAKFPEKKMIPRVEKDEYFVEEIEIYRQKKWGGYLNMPGTVLHAECSAVQEFYRHKMADGKNVYKRFPYISCLRKIKISIGEEEYLFESL